MKILETKFLGTVYELRYIVEERKAVVINCGQNVPGAIWGNNIILDNALGVSAYMI